MMKIYGGLIGYGMSIEQKGQWIHISYMRMIVRLKAEGVAMKLKAMELSRNGNRQFRLGKIIGVSDEGKEVQTQ